MIDSENDGSFSIYEGDGWCTTNSFFAETFVLIEHLLETSKKQNVEEVKELAKLVCFNVEKAINHNFTALFNVLGADEAIKALINNLEAIDEKIDVLDFNFEREAKSLMINLSAIDQ
jgi:hypothetical protein